MKSTQKLGAVLSLGFAVLYAPEGTLRTMSPTPREVTTPRTGSARTPSAGGERTPGIGMPGVQNVDTSRSSMPAYRRTPGTGGRVGKGPKRASECGGDTWRSFGNPAFQSQKACEDWAKSHGQRSPAPAAPVRTPGSAR